MADPELFYSFIEHRDCFLLARPEVLSIPIGQVMTLPPFCMACWAAQPQIQYTGQPPTRWYSRYSLPAYWGVPVPPGTSPGVAWLGISSAQVCFLMALSKIAFPYSKLWLHGLIFWDLPRLEKEPALRKGKEKCLASDLQNVTREGLNVASPIL